MWCSQSKQINTCSQIDLKAGRMNGCQSALNYSGARWIHLSLSLSLLWMDCLHSDIHKCVRPRCKRTDTFRSRCSIQVITWRRQNIVISVVKHLGSVFSFPKQAITLMRGEKLAIMATSLPQNVPVAKVHLGRLQQSVDMSPPLMTAMRKTRRIQQRMLF